MAKPPEEFQDDKTRPAPEDAKGGTPRLQPRWREGSKGDEDEDEDELFNDMPV